MDLELIQLSGLDHLIRYGVVLAVGVVGVVVTRRARAQGDTDDMLGVVFFLSVVMVGIGGWQLLDLWQWVRVIDPSLIVEMGLAD